MKGKSQEWDHFQKEYASLSFELRLIYFHDLVIFVIFRWK